MSYVTQIIMILWLDIFTILFIFTSSLRQGKHHPIHDMAISILNIISLSIKHLFKMLYNTKKTTQQIDKYISPIFGSGTAFSAKPLGIFSRCLGYICLYYCTCVPTGAATITKLGMFCAKLGDQLSWDN